MEILENKILSDFQLSASNDIKSVIKDIEGLNSQIVVLKHLPRSGKTYTLLEYLNNSNSFSLYVSDVHEQMEQLTTNFDKMWVIKGASKMCPLLKEDHAPFWVKKYFGHGNNGKLKRNIPCILCDQKDCEYNKQFDFPEANATVTIAKESLVNPRIVSAYDHIIIDEKMDKANLIQPYCPTFKEDALLSFDYALEIYEVYEEIKNLIDNKSIIEEREYLEKLKTDAKFISSKKVLGKTIYEIRDLDNNELVKDVVPFLANLGSTINWMEKCYDINEYRDRFHVPYIHYAFDMLREYGSNLIFANATFDEGIYNLLKNQYKYDLPEIRTIMDKPIENKNSYLLHYNNLGRSCSRSGLKGSAEGSIGYFPQIFKMIESIHRFCQKRGLRSGIITFSEYEDCFSDFNVVDHFVAHRGKNDFDEVDVLVILGTFNIPRLALLDKHYAISGEYLDKKYLENDYWKTKDINGCKIAISKHKGLMNTKLFLLYDEHLQAILRSGAHINDKKVVIVFGYVPDGTEKMFSYKKFDSTKQLINGYLTNSYSEGRKRAG